jgi:biopolymer transport protein TolR
MAGLIRNKVQTARRKSNSNRPIAEINVTPFVDVTLVLLIIFMVAAPLLTVGVSIELPKTAATPLPNEQEEPLTITLTETGNLWLQKTEIEFADLDNKLKSILAERNNDKIFLRADGTNSYETVMKLMGALNGAGFNNIGLVTDTGGPTFNGGF